MPLYEQEVAAEVVLRGPEKVVEAYLVTGEYDYVFDLQQITRARGGDAFPVSYRLPE